MVAAVGWAKVRVRVRWDGVPGEHKIKVKGVGQECPTPQREIPLCA